MFRVCMQNFKTFRVTIFFVCCAHRCEWSGCTFSSANSICKQSCVLLFSARISLTLFFEKATAVRKLARGGATSKRSISYTILGLFLKTMPCKPAFHACSAIKGVRNWGDWVHTPGWAWYFAKTLLPAQRRLIVFAYFLLVNLST